MRLASSRSCQKMCLPIWAAGPGCYLPVCPLLLREHDGARHRVVSRIFDSSSGGRRASNVGGTRAGFLLEPQRGHHALRHRLSSDLLRRRLCWTGNLVETRLCDFAPQPGLLAGYRTLLVEACRIMVNFLGSLELPVVIVVIQKI